MNPPEPTRLEARHTQFRALHAAGCFVIPNPWDVGSARYLASLGFKALATTSSGFAWSHGARDGAMPLEAVLGYLRSIVAATDLPVNADFESGYADTPEGVAHNVGLACATGISGISIEDSTGNPDAPLMEIPRAVERLRAAREAIAASGQNVMLIGRAENFFVGRPDIDDAIARLQRDIDADELAVKRLKKRKLQLKDAIARLESALIPDLDA